MKTAGSGQNNTASEKVEFDDREHSTEVFGAGFGPVS